METIAAEGSPQLFKEVSSYVKGIPQLLKNTSAVKKSHQLPKKVLSS
jgi:hypothetical protein